MRIMDVNYMFLCMQQRILTLIAEFIDFNTNFDHSGNVKIKMKTPDIAFVKVIKCSYYLIMSLWHIRITSNLIFNTTSTLNISAISFLLSIGEFYLHYRRFVITLAFNFNHIYKFYWTKRCTIHKHYFLRTITTKSFTLTKPYADSI